MRIDTVDHIGVLTDDSDETAGVFEAMGAPVVWDNHIDEHNARVVFIEFGDVYIELLEPTGPGMVKDHYDAHGAGFEHVAYRVDDIDAAVEALRAEGFEFETEEPRAGAGESRIIYFERESTDGLAVELVELLPEDVRY